VHQRAPISGLPEIGKNPVSGLPEIGKNPVSGLPEIGKSHAQIGQARFAGAPLHRIRDAMPRNSNVAAG